MRIVIRAESSGGALGGGHQLMSRPFPQPACLHLYLTISRLSRPCTFDSSSFYRHDKVWL